MAEEMKILSEKISELNDISKDAWKLLSEIEDDVKRMLARVYAKVGRHVCKEYRQLLCRVTAWFTLFNCSDWNFIILSTKF